MVREAGFDSLNLVSDFEEDKKRVDSHPEMPDSCPHLENTAYDTIPYVEVSPFPFFFSVTSSTSLRLFPASLEISPCKLG